MQTSNSVPTSDAVLDALLIRDFQISIETRRGHIRSVWNTTEGIEAQYSKSSAFKNKSFPATREGLIEALIFAGLEIGDKT